MNEIRNRAWFEQGVFDVRFILLTSIIPYRLSKEEMKEIELKIDALLTHYPSWAFTK